MKSSWFQHPLYGSALGFARDNPASEGFVRCLLCKRDVKVASRGITTFGEHCRSEKHHRLDCLWRMQRGLRLRARDFSLMSDEEEEAMKEQLAGVIAPDFETCPDFTAMEVLSMEAVGSSVWNHVREESEQRLASCRTLLCLIVDAVHRDGDTASVAMLWNSLASSDSGLQDLLGVSCNAGIIEVRLLIV